MDALKAEVERKRKEINAGKHVKKYMRRGEQELLNNKVPADIVTTTEEAHQTIQSKKKISEEQDEVIGISSSEIERRLRLLNEPIRLFAETDSHRFKRLKALSSREERHHNQNDFKKAWESTDTELQKNVFDQVEEERDDVIIDTGDEFILLSSDLHLKDPEKNKKLLTKYLRYLLQQWEIYLKNRPDDIKNTGSGKMLTAAHIQSKESLQTFFKQLKKHKIAEDVVILITQICQALVCREYIQANDFYLRLSIGNAAWPIGVKSVGMHERAGDAKVSSCQVAHVLNDEEQRKWIQGVKRLMTFCQTRWPPSDMSKAMG